MEEDFRRMSLCLPDLVRDLLWHHDVQPAWLELLSAGR